MCILCVLSRWSRRFVTMLPWLVIPFIITWAFSQLLPPGYRLEVTSTRLACLGVLLSSLAWYELLMPWLSSWRARRNALLRERKLIEAQEAAKWRKEATRRCRNCFTAYKVQTPGGGKFTCTVCGHVSKRPVLEVPHLAGQGLPQSAIYSTAQVIHGPGTILIRGPLKREMSCWSKASERRGCVWFGENTHLSEHCRAWKCVLAVFSLIGTIFSCIAFIWDHVRGSRRHNCDGSQHSQKLKDVMGSIHTNKGEKARRKADEKRQARLEKELLEAEERKQREDVARLVEERRRQREEKLQTEKESEKEAAAEKEREMRRVRETERRRKEKLKERIVGQTEPITADQGTYPVSGVGAQDGEESIPSKTNFTSISIKLAESLKNAKVSKTLRHQGLKPKSASDYLTRFDFTKAAKHGSNPSLKTGGSFVGKNGISITEKPVGRMHSDVYGVSASISPEKSRFSSKIGQESVWKNSPWSKSNAWTKPTDVVKDDNVTMSSQMLVGNDERLNQTTKSGSNIFNNKAVGINQSPPPARGSAIQPPIAPPPTVHAASLHQLFSTPTIFPPLDYPNQLEQIPQSEIKSSFLPDCTYFESARHATFQTCPISGLCITSSPPPFYAQNSSVSPLQPRSISQDGHSLYNSMSMGSTCLSEAVENGAVKCNPVSPISLSVCDTASDMPIISPTSDAVKMGSLDFINAKDENFIWDFSTVAVDGLNNMSNEQQPWNMTFHDTKLHESIEHEDHFERLQLSHISTVQSLFDSEIISPESLSLSPQKKENPSEGYFYHVLKSAVQIWDDADNLHKVPPEFVDCITQEIMQDPVITADGHSYERSAIEKWLKSHDTSPKTGEVLPPPPGGAGVDKTLRPNHILRGQIIEYKEKLAKMHPKAESWSNTSKEDSFVANPGSLSVLSF